MHIAYCSEDFEMMFEQERDEPPEPGYTLTVEGTNEKFDIVQVIEFRDGVAPLGLNIVSTQGVCTGISTVEEDGSHKAVDVLVLIRPRPVLVEGT